LDRARLESIHRIDELCQSNPSKARLPSVLDAADDRLIDAGDRFELPLAQTERSSTATDRAPEEAEATLLPGVEVLVVPWHGQTIEVGRYLAVHGPARAPASPKRQPPRYAAIGITWKSRCWRVNQASRHRTDAEHQPGRPGRQPTSTFRGSVASVTMIATGVRA
jgi:hypothetical protein